MITKRTLPPPPPHNTTNSRCTDAFQPISRRSCTTRAPCSGLARPETAFHIGPTGFTNYMLFCPGKIDQNEHSIKIGVDVIQRTNSCKFLGIMIDDKLTWSEHISYTKSKLCRSLYAISRSKNVVPLKHLKTLYDSLIHPYISYGIVLWGSTYSSYLQKIRICQNKAIRHIYRSAYNAHTDPLFKESKILKLDQLYILEAGKLVFDALHGILPAPLLHVYMPNTTIHTHNTRQRDNPHSHQIRTLVARNSIVHRAPQIWSDIPKEIRKMNTRNSFKRALTQSLLSGY